MRAILQKRIDEVQKHTTKTYEEAGEESVVYWLQIGFAGNLKSRHDLRHRGTILLAGSKDP